MQNTLRRGFIQACLLALLAMSAAPAMAGTAPSDGAHDFDWEIGTWKTQVRRLARPLSGSKEWVEYSGTSVIRAVLDGPDPALLREGFAQVVVLRDPAEIEVVRFRRHPSSRRPDPGRPTSNPP